MLCPASALHVMPLPWLQQQLQLMMVPWSTVWRLRMQTRVSQTMAMAGMIAAWRMMMMTTTTTWVWQVQTRCFPAPSLVQTDFATALLHLAQTPALWAPSADSFIANLR